MSDADKLKKIKAKLGPEREKARELRAKRVKEIGVRTKRS